MRPGTNDFTSLPKEGVLRIFSALKNPTTSAGFEPANLGTKAQHATSRPPKPLIIPIERTQLPQKAEVVSCMWEVSKLNLGWNTDYPDKCFVFPFSVFQGRCSVIVTEEKYAIARKTGTFSVYLHGLARETSLPSGSSWTSTCVLLLCMSRISLHPSVLYYVSSIWHCNDFGLSNSRACDLLFILSRYLRS